jgi:hypothetical protein
LRVHSMYSRWRVKPDFREDNLQPQLGDEGRSARISSPVRAHGLVMLQVVASFKSSANSRTLS